MSLDQRAAKGLNAMYDYPSYDFNGHFKLGFEKDQPKAQNQSLDARLEKQVNDYLHAQKIYLTTQQKQDLYRAIAHKEDSAYRSNKSKAFTDFAINLFDSLQFSYDGSVHYKQKMAALNLMTKYEKPTLLVQAKVPMIVDFQNYKFYTNYFALMPYLVNQDNQSNFAFIDFSKYKAEINRVDVKKLADYLKQTTMLQYSLANPKDIEIIALTSQDKAQGVVEKIRLNMSLEEMIMQMRLFDKVNRSYFTESVLGLTATEMAKADAKMVNAGTETRISSSEEHDDYATSDMSADEADAYRSSQKLYKLVNAHVAHPASEEDIDAVATATAVTKAEMLEISDESESAVASAEAIDAAEVSEGEMKSAVEDAAASEDHYLSRAQCEVILEQNAKAVMGDITYCQAEYDVDLLNRQNTKAKSLKKPAIFSAEASELDRVFEQYATSEFKDVQAFKLLWEKHQAEIHKVLTKPQQQNPFVVDVGLDQKGRAVKVDYDLAYVVDDFGRFKFKADFNAFNYGNATPINRNELKNAKSIEEISKGSMFESMIKGMGKSFGISDQDLSKSTQVTKQLSLDEQLDQLAVQVYDTSKSYMKTYQAVFIMKLTAEQPEIVQSYSITELNEIARVYAYGYAGESIFNPQGKELAELEQLAKKHHLELSEQFDDRVGDTVYSVVLKAINATKDRQAWNKFVQQYKTPKTVFEHYYDEQFQKGEDLDAQEKARLKATANILAQAFDDSRNNKLSQKSIEKLNQDSLEYIDYDLYRTTFEKVQKSFKK
ncbi:hypothetical protein [Acinetobacter sp. ANC 4648]|uniref:hypothetical protein n=1 Tax=Acinetobacter sp. ANC 4648 TaxID=1977875 RepID=UPI000A331F72|nr:hypothetical protein [Acinetobacter sp. ANC 4648]OTG84869.1 hypothetical protein B9T27_01210 [Acinetobacter sp. ANC 4648]